MKVTVSVPGSCGEIVQGTHNGLPYLVTCPINLFTCVTISDNFAGVQGLGRKSQIALKRTLDYLGKSDFKGGISLFSELPIGKGMASSSADIAAVCFAAAAYYGVELSAPEVSRIAAGIEPTDGVFFENIVRINQMTGECLAAFDKFPPLQIAVFDTGGEIDTVSFHERDDLDALVQKNEKLTDQAMDLLIDSTEAEDWAKAATISALANQSILPKKNLPEILETAKNERALGINAAHSGTVFGVLFAPDFDTAKIRNCARKLIALFPQLRYLGCTELISGGKNIFIEKQ